mmetsp:Transcript_17976/g.57493  ORF Transcript_17976/g.57493 Transcript_17976/m.57493 type:complete len:240 (+) Transcript_17976:591-1310(+)
MDATAVNGPMELDTSLLPCAKETTHAVVTMSGRNMLSARSSRACDAVTGSASPGTTAAPLIPMPATPAPLPLTPGAPRATASEEPERRGGVAAPLSMVTPDSWDSSLGDSPRARPVRSGTEREWDTVADPAMDDSPPSASSSPPPLAPPPLASNATSTSGSRSTFSFCEKVNTVAGGGALLPLVEAVPGVSAPEPKEPPPPPLLLLPPTPLPEACRRRREAAPSGTSGASSERRSGTVW